MAGTTRPCMVVVTRVVGRIRGQFPADPTTGSGTGVPTRFTPFG